MPFKEYQAKIQTLIDFGSKVNVMSSNYIASLGLKVWLTNIKAPKIVNFIFQMFGIVLANFNVNNKLD